MKKTHVNNTDFLASDLPKNRKELFFDVLKNQWRNLLILALIIFVMFLPFVVLRYYNLIIINNLISGSSEDLANEVFNSSFVYNFVVFLLMIIIGIFFGGVGRIYKKLAYNEGFFIGADFIKGIKENWY